MVPSLPGWQNLSLLACWENTRNTVIQYRRPPSYPVPHGWLVSSELFVVGSFDHPALSGLQGGSAVSVSVSPSSLKRKLCKRNTS